MDSMAHQWLREWLDDGGFIGHGHADLWYLGIVNARATRQDFVGFREQMRQLLADAEAGRELREGSRDRDFFYKWLRPDLKRD